MQKYLTLDEAAKLLNISSDELREMAKKKTIRAFQDRGSWRFRAQDIEEEARKRGFGSDAELQLGESKPAPAKKPAHEDLLPADFSLDDEVPLGREKFGAPGPKSGPRSGRTPKPGSDSDVRLVMESDAEFPVDQPRAKPESSGPKSGRKKGAESSSRLAPSDAPSDSDVKVVPSSRDSAVHKGPKSPSDSDIRLHEAGSGKNRSDGGIITEEIDLDAEEARLRETKKTQPGGRPRKVTQAAPPGLPTSSPFELSENDIDVDPRARPKPGEDSSSDFELVAFDASKSPADLGSDEIPLLPDDSVTLGAEVSGANAGNSGINLDDPVDSGLSLEDGGSDELAFDLSSDSGATPRPAPKGATSAGKPAPKETSKQAPKKPADESSSEFELSLDEPEPAGEDSSSDFELSMDDSSISESDSEFELSLEDSDEGPAVVEGSDSEFELTLDDEGGLSAPEEGDQDIFEDTNFDVPALEDESGSEAVALDDSGDTDLEGSDFEISLDDDSAAGEDSDSGSQVVSVEDEDADVDAATIARPKKAKGKAKAKAAAVDSDEEEALDEDEGDLDLDLGSVPGQKKKKAKAAAEEEEDEDEDEDFESGIRPAPAAAEWGALPAVLLFPTVAVMFIVGLMGFELIRGMWGYHQPSQIGKPVVDTIARMFDEGLPK